MTVTLESMFTSGSFQIQIIPDSWQKNYVDDVILIQKDMQLIMDIFSSACELPISINKIKVMHTSPSEEAYVELNICEEGKNLKWYIALSILEAHSVRMAL